MKIVVNAKEFEFDKNITIEELLDYLKVKDKVMAVAINMEIVKKDKWGITSLKEGDRVELLHFVGGG